MTFEKHMPLCAVLLHVVHAEQFGTPDMATAAFPKVYW